MKKRIQQRISIVLITALFLIAVMGTLSLYYFNQISTDIEEIIKSDIQKERVLEKAQSVLIDLKSLRKAHIKSLKNEGPPMDLARLLGEANTTLLDFSKLAAESSREKTDDLLANLEQYTKTLNGIEPSAEKRPGPIQLDSANTELMSLETEMLADISFLLEKRYEQLEQHRSEIEILISNAHRNMLLILFLCLAGGVTLLILAPRQVTSPISRYIDAIREIEELKFETRLPVHGQDEVAHLGMAINGMIDRLMEFDEMKQKRILFEKNRQRVLANMVDLGVLILSIEGEVLFMNAQLANVLKLDSDAYLNNNYHNVDFPAELRELIEEVLYSREKSDSRMMILNYKGDEEVELKSMEVLADVGVARNYQGEVVNIILTFEDITNAKGESVFKRIKVAEKRLT